MLINKPVAWMEYIQGEEWEVWFVEPTALPKGHTYKPLYTHPVKEQDTDCQYCKQGCIRCDARKQLTDEEITEMAKRKANQILMDLLMPDVGNERRIDWNVGCTREHLKNFAKAILRKAQEK